MSLLGDILGGIFDGPAPRRRRPPSKRPAAALRRDVDLIGGLLGSIGDLFDGPPSNRRPGVAGPMRSESSIPSVRSPGLFDIPQARVGFDRRLGYGVGGGLGLSTPNIARAIANLQADTEPDFGSPGNLIPRSRRLGTVERDVRRGEAMREAEDDPSTLDVLSIASLGIPGLGLAGAGLRGLRAAQTLSAAGRGAGTARNVVEANRAAQVLRGAARGAGHVAMTPLRHPIATTASPAIAELPGATLNRDPGQLMDALEGTGVLAAALGEAGGAARNALPGVLGGLASDAISLPAQVLPSIYLTGAAGLEAAQGRPERAERLWDDFKEQSALPALVSGDFGEAASRAERHPLYTGLELAGLKAVAGRGLGAAARKGALGERAAGVAAAEPRRPLHGYDALGGPVAIDRPRFSKDIITALAQRQRERGIAERGYQATPRQLRRYLPERLDRTIYSGAAIQKRAIAEGEGALLGVRERAGSPETADVLSLGVQRIARTPETAVADLRSYRDGLIAEQAALRQPGMEGRLRANEATIARVDAALRDPDPDALMAAADEFTLAQRPVQSELHRAGYYAPEQTEIASALGYLRTHEGATHGLSRESKAAEAEILEAMKQPGAETGPLLGRLNSIRAKGELLDPEGNPFTLDAIRAAMAEKGITAPGFVSNRPTELSRGGSYSRPSIDRGSGLTQRATGQAVVQGTSNTGFEQLSRQFLGGISRGTQAKNYDRVTQAYGWGGRQFRDSSEGQLAIQNPDLYGVPDIPGGWVTRRVVPWPTRRAELEAALRRGEPDQSVPDPSLAAEEGFMADAIARAYEPTDGPVVLFPRIVAARERRHFAEKSPGEKTVEAYTGLWKRVILPTSPGWMGGQIADVWGVRTAVAGITPGDIRAGFGLERIAKKELTPDELTASVESLLPGGLYGMQRRLQPHRSYEQMVGESVEPLWKAATIVRNAPGSKTVGDLYRRYSDSVLNLNNKYIERTPQYGALAKIARRELDMSRRQFARAVKAQEPVVLDFVRGFRNQDKLDRYAREIEATFGNWGKNGPGARRFLTTWAPFWMWARAATKFAFVTLPRDHPVLTGILAASQEMTREERQRFGLDFDGEAPLPEFMQGGIPLPDGGTLRLSNLTTFGFFSDYPQALASMAAPQFSSGLLAGLGLDWKGDRLVDKSGRPASNQQKIVAAAAATGESFIPFMNVVQQIAERGFKGALPARPFGAEETDYFRRLSNMRPINVPITDDSSSSNPWDSISLDGEGEANPWDKIRLP